MAATARVRGSDPVDADRPETRFDLELQPFVGALGTRLLVDRDVEAEALAVAVQHVGLAAADRRVDVQRTVLGREYDADELVGEARSRIGDGGADTEVVYDCRFKGQSFELTVRDPADFPAAHEERYGFTEDGGEVEVVTVRATARLAGPQVELGGEASGELAPGARVTGPRVFALPESTLYVPDGWSGEVDDDGTVVLHRSG